MLVLESRAPSECHLLEYPFNVLGKAIGKLMRYSKGFIYVNWPIKKTLNNFFFHGKSLKFERSC